MSGPLREICVAIDGGTTNTRARLLHGATVLAVASRAVGVRDVAISGSATHLRRAVAECVADVVRAAAVRAEDISLVCASGMLTSNVGLYEVPHVLAPAGLHDLARHVVRASFPDIVPRPIHLIPGIKTQPVPAILDNLAQLDMLRGEESEAFGALEARSGSGPLCILLPGSHTKLVYIDRQSRIAASYTTVGGELMQALAQHTIVASSIDWPPTGEPMWPAVEAGVRFARNWGIARGTFAVRLAEVLVGADGSFRTWFYVGLVVGSDWDELSRWEYCTGDVPFLVVGREPLRSLYGRLARAEWSDSVEILDPSVVETAAARGAIAIAQLCDR